MDPECRVLQIIRGILVIPNYVNFIPITVAYGDGIGPEIMNACLHIIKEAGARIEFEVIEIGEKVYLSGNSAGIEPSAWQSLRRTKVLGH